MKDKLIIIQEYKKLIEQYCKYSCIYPRKYYFLKDLLEKELFCNLKEFYQLNHLSDVKVRIHRKEELLGKIQYLNYLFTRIQTLGIISEKQYKILFIQIEVVYKYLLGWLKCEKKC